jgi:phospholipid-binding lipoprotein MlaA
MPDHAPRSTTVWTVVLVALLSSACASTPPARETHRADPWEKLNRSTHSFNNAVDRAVLKPVATAYRDHVPQPVRKGVSNVLDNLEQPSIIVNQFLQGKLFEGLQDTGRFLLNSTFGVAGIFDLATRAGVDKHDEDFGQTLGKWGVASGPYLEIPFLGPSTVRDFPARIVDAFNLNTFDNEIPLLEEDWFEYSRIGLNAIDTRAELLSLDRMREQAFDEYVFIRDAWLQRREYNVRDGDVPEEEPLEEFPDEEMPEEEPPAEEPATSEPASGEETEAPQPAPPDTISSP